MSLVKKPGSAEGRMAAVLPPVEFAEPGVGVRIVTTEERTAMARKKAPKTGTYQINGNFYRFMEGDEFPEGVEPDLVEEQEVATDDSDEEERSQGPAPENKAKQGAPENRAKS